MEISESNSVAAVINRKRPRALVFFDHDVTIRHFILSGSLDRLESEFDLTYVFNLDFSTEKKTIFTDVHKLGKQSIEITNIPRVRMGSWGPLESITVLHNHRGTENFNAKKIRLADMGKLNMLKREFLSLPLLFPWVKRYFLRKQGNYQPLIELVKEYRPDILIHPSLLTGHYINELITLKSDLKIPLLILMNSWDNPSQKSTAVDQPDCYGVWGQVAKEEAVKYLKLDGDRVEVVGAAQFDVFREPIKETDQQLRSEFCVPTGKRVLLYAGVSKSINEIRHLRLLDEAISQGHIPDCHVIYRPHPWRGELVDDEKNFLEERFNNISMDPHMIEMYKGAINSSVGRFYMADLVVTHRLLQLISGTISTLSTVLLESLLHGKPIVAFLSPHDMKRKYKGTSRLLPQLAHFSSLWNSPGVICCESDNDLNRSVVELLSMSKCMKLRMKIKQHASRYVDLNSKPYKDRLLDVANNLLGTKQ